MKTTTLDCSACGAPIEIPEDAFSVTCGFCGATIGVERGADYVVLKSAELLAGSISESGEGTRQAIRENTQTTQNELHILQLQQEINATKTLLDNVQREIRSYAIDGLSVKEAIIIRDLHTDEFQYMDKIRLLEYRLYQPDPNDWNACLAFEIRELNHIINEISVLQSSSHIHRNELIKAFKEREDALQKHTMLLKVNLLIKTLPSFHYRVKSDTDLEELSHHLALYKADENTLMQHYKTPEGMYIFKEIKKREKALQEKITRLEEERSSLPFSGHDRILNLDQASSPYNKTSSGHNSKRQSINLAGFLGKRPGVKSLNKGISQSMILMLITVILGFLLTGIVASIFSIPAENSPIWVFFLVLPIGFLFAARSFLIYSVPDFTIQGVGGLPDLKLETWKTGVAFDNPITVKLLVAINIVVFIMLVIFCLLAILLPVNNDLSMVIFLISIPLSIAAGVLGYIKTIF